MRSGASFTNREFFANFIQNRTQESGGFGIEHEKYQQSGCLWRLYADPFEFQSSNVVNVGKQQTRYTSVLSRARKS